MSPSADSPRGGSRETLARVLPRLWAAGPVALVLAFAAWLLWPVPLGTMPLSADHTVHLTRIVLTAERLGTTGALSGWEPTWFFGFPLGELYPQLGDLLIIAIHALGHTLSFGALTWPAAYALGFFVVFAVQGLVLVRIGRLFGFGAVPGLIAALLMLADAGFTREGGWMYTVYFGVWPQALATSLAWLGLGELARGLGYVHSAHLADPAATPTTPDAASTAASPGSASARATLIAGLCFALALLAHPIALPTLAIGGLLLIVTLVPRAPVAWRLGLARCLFAGLLAALLAGWWWVPMLQHKAWMASYGWLFAPLDTMLKWVVEDGRLAQRMPGAVGFTAVAGLALAGLGVGKTARFVALFALLQWLLASNEAFWLLRLDRFSEGFTHIQYQRFLIGAKPGLFLCAGLATAAPAGWAARLIATRSTRPRPKLALAAAAALIPISAGLGLWMIQDSRAVVAELEVAEVGVVQTERVVGDPEFDAHYAEFLAWARDQWDARDHDYRIAAKATRNSHVFMDAPVWTHTPQYKLGFTPGDNFVHKPESGQRELFDKLGVRWIVGLDRGRPRGGEVARFGRIHVREHRGQTRNGTRGLAWLEGGGSVEVLDADLRGGLVRVRVRDVEAGARLVFGVAGYPRWHLSLDGEALEWFEEPVLSPSRIGSSDDDEVRSATLAERRAGALRGGKARGDDGSEPTLIAAELPPGTDDAIVELRYHGRGTLEWLAEITSLLTWLGLGLALAVRPGSSSDGAGPRWPVLAWGSAIFQATEARLVAILHPLTVAVVVPAVLGLAVARWQLAAEAEASTLLGWIEAGAAQTQRVETGPVKAEMLIRPAVILRPRPGKPAQIELRIDELPTQLRGFVGIDDDQALSPGTWGRQELSIEARWASSPASKWYPITTIDVLHQPKLTPIDVPSGALANLPVYLRITATAHGKRLPRTGLHLDLGRAPPEPEPAE